MIYYRLFISFGLLQYTIVFILVGLDDEANSPTGNSFSNYQAISSQVKKKTLKKNSVWRLTIIFKRVQVAASALMAQEIERRVSGESLLGSIQHNDTISFVQLPQIHQLIRLQLGGAKFKQVFSKQVRKKSFV